MAVTDFSSILANDRTDGIKSYLLALSEAQNCGQNFLVFPSLKSLEPNNCIFSPDG